MPMDTRVCAACGEGDDCGTMQLCDGCDTPFHWNVSCARRMGIRKLAIEGDVLCKACRRKDKQADAKGADGNE